MTVAAITWLIVSLLIVPGGLVASAVFLVRRPEVAQYPPMPDGIGD
jgi:hypothetical protein